MAELETYQARREELKQRYLTTSLVKKRGSPPA